MNLLEHSGVRDVLALALAMAGIILAIVAGNGIYADFFSSDTGVDLSVLREEHLVLTENQLVLKGLFGKQAYFAQCSFDLNAIREIEVPLNDTGAVRKRVDFANVVCPPLPGC